MYAGNKFADVSIGNVSSYSENDANGKIIKLSLVEM